MPKVKSEVWKHFRRQGNVAFCTICFKELKYCGNTTNLKNHVIHKHPKIFQNSEDSQDGQGTADVEKDRPSGTARSSSCSSAAIASIGTSPSSYPVESSNSYSRTQFQPSITKAFQDISAFKNGGTKEIEVTNAIAFMLAKDSLPLSTVEKDGFKHLLKVLAPHYQVPSRRRITSIIDDKYVTTAEKVKKQLEKAESIVLTTDIWTETHTTKAFLGLTAHYLLDSYQHISLNIGVQEMNEPHRATYISHTLENMCSEWGIANEKITAVVTDGGSNIVSAISQTFGSSKHLLCFAHTLNLIVQKAVEKTKSIQTLLTKVKNVVTFFKQCINAADELRHVQKVNGKSEGEVLKLIQDCQTRWNSTFYMLERFIKLSTTIATIILQIPRAPPMLTAVELQEAMNVITLLKPFEQISKELCAQQYTTCSLVIPLVHCLNNFMLSSSSVDTDGGKEFKIKLMQEMEKRFQHVENVSLLAVSTLLDPRFKRLHFDSPVAAVNAVNRVTKMLQQLQADQNNNQSNTLVSETQKQVVASTSPDDLWTFHDRLAVSSASRSEEVGSMPLELKLYLQQPVTARKSCPYDYWRAQKNSFPSLHQLACKFLPICATSVPSERLFSKAGAALGKERCRLTGKRLSKLLFLGSLNKEDWKM